MDANKLEELRRIGYTIPRTCGLCVHGTFVGASDFGTCATRQYDHLKHTGPKRQLSIYRGGTCPDKFELDEVRASRLVAYIEFVV